MAWILLEGLDRSGKSSIAEIYKKQGFDVVHMNAPDKKYSQPGYSGPSYLEDMVEMYTIYDNKNVVFDRTPYGEAVWPEIFNRQSLLSAEDFEYLQSLEYNNGASRIMMYDEDVEAHWQRCVDNKEPLNRLQFVQAGRKYDELARTFNFERRQLGDFKTEDEIPTDEKLLSKGTSDRDASKSGSVRQKLEGSGDTKLNSEHSSKSLEEKLERANAIRALLNGPIVKKKGEIYKDLEGDIKLFLENELQNLFLEERTDDFTQEEVQILKIYASRIKEKLG